MPNNPKTIKEITESLAMALTHSEQGFYDKNEEYVKNKLSDYKLSILDEVSLGITELSIRSNKITDFDDIKNLISELRSGK